MPVVADTICTSTQETNTGRANLIAPEPTGHYANMGWVGYVWFQSNKLGANNILRVTSADVNLSQEITKPDVIDGRMDPSTYQFGPKIVEGTLTMPLIADTQDPENWTGRDCPELEDLTGIASSVLNNVWCWATARGAQGRLLYDDARLNIRYANHAGFVFDNCVINTYSLSVAQQDVVTSDINVIGRGREQSATSTGNTQYAVEPSITDFLAPARVLTWNDVTVNGIRGCRLNGQHLFYSNQVREFSMEINNNADRFYTLCGSLFPVDVNVGKREITGSLTLMGLQDRLRDLAETNPERFTEKNEIRLAFYVGNDRYIGADAGFSPRDWTDDENDASHLGALWSKRIMGVIFEIEEMSMTNEVFETTIAWHAMADDQSAYEAFTPQTSPSFPAWS